MSSVAPDHHTKKVLVVEDSGRGIASMIEDYGVSNEAWWVSNIIDAASAVERASFDLIVIDVQFNYGRYEAHLLTRIRDQSTAPIIVITTKNPIVFAGNPFRSKAIHFFDPGCISNEELSEVLVAILLGTGSVGADPLIADATCRKQQSFIQDLSSPAIITDPSGKVLFVNQSAINLFDKLGGAPQDWLGENFDAIMAKRGAASLDVDSVDSTGAPYSLALRCFDGQWLGRERAECILMHD